MTEYSYKFPQSYLNRILKEIQFSNPYYKVVGNKVYDKQGKLVLKIEQGKLYYDLPLNELQKLTRI